MENKWDKSVVINAPIEMIWHYLDGSLENMQKIMPNVVDNQPVKITENIIGSVHRQSYREGNRVMEYDVHTLDYNNQDNYKKLKIGFRLANMFQIEGCYELTKESDAVTSMRYTGFNKPLKWFIKPFVLLSGDKVVNEFLDRVKRVAEGKE